MTRRKTISALRRKIPDLRSTYGLSHLSLFGSAARNEARRNSDVDLLVEFDRPISLITLVRFKHEMERLLGRRVDVATPGAISPGLFERIEPDLIRVA